MYKLYKDVTKCFFYLSILIELSKGSTMSGYDLMVQMNNWGLKVSPGTIYDQIKKLESKGIIEPLESSSGKSKTYKITDEGLMAFKEFKETWKQPIEYLCQNICS